VYVNKYMFVELLGLLENASLGNVYAEDLDDWDVDNKTFTFISAEADQKFR